ncbi:hypothetical protein HDU78_003194 [Chytriomyces hyalinus]|nr:hypothetical protein HDU78_003194 [Chytriomyces hyalinus]
MSKVSLDSLLNDPSLLSWTTVESVVAEFKADLAAFVDAVDWSDRIFPKLAAFHVVVSLFVAYLFWSKRATSVLGFSVLIVLAALILAAEQLNTWAAANYNLIAQTNYFDKNGAFITTVFSGPLLANILIYMFAVLREVSSTLITAKRKQLGMDKVKSPKQTTAEKDGEATPASPADDTHLRQRKNAASK